ncbi:M48 family metallopeptidase [Maribellus sediminis]|uniref:M48 family metallopeptidase n=1 Tax=Maribellus sediminis TaxID=2696285 RepID=UPI0014314BFD|nr:SprT family zinc-dependent metalloprotease [Maribellus sediminis]
MPEQVVHLKAIGMVTFSKNRRSKNIKLSVKPDKTVRVSFPYYVSKKRVLNFLLENQEWIRQQQGKMEERKTRVDAGTVIKSKIYSITFANGPANRVSKKGRELTIWVPDFDAEDAQAYIEKCLTEVYRFEAKQILPGRLKSLAEKHGFAFQRVTIRDNRRNWGSCSSQNSISLNLQMMKLPDKLIDYILLHELVHTEIKDHSAKFWSRLDEVTDNQAKELSRQVRKYSTYTL